MATGGGLDFSPECTHVCGSVWVPPAGPELAGGREGGGWVPDATPRRPLWERLGWGEVGLCMQPQSPQPRPQGLVRPGGGRGVLGGGRPCGL